MGVTLTIVFTGLCALVTDGDRGPAQVLLVDATGVGAVDGVRLPAHAPTLVASLATLANAETSGPTRVVGAGSGGGRADQLGVWDLAGSEVRIRVQGGGEGGLELFRPPRGATSWPAPPRDVDDPAAWRDLRFVPEMQTLTGDGRIDPALVAPDSASDALPRAVAARVQLEGGRIEAGIPSADVHRADVFEFKGPTGEAKLRQAVTDTIRWTLETRSEALVVEIFPAGGGSARQLLLGPSSTPHTLFVSNLPAQNVPDHALHGMSDERAAALHFGVYYSLLLNEPANRPLPIVVPRPTAKGVGNLRTSLCPPAVFRRR
jgi:hypothetical protein